jgi:peptidoglycan/xylan/chitin deacetylase (PgdA/CDA1 family)
MRNQIVYRIFNLVVSLLVAAVDFLRDQFARFFGRPPRKMCVVFAYHAVRPEQKAAFARQMEMIVRHARPIAADLAVLPDEHADYVAITFDDGVENLIENAFPALLKQNIPATVFVVTDMLGEYPRWEYRGANSTLQERTMSLEQLRSLSPDLITIGSHTATHPYLPSISPESLQLELKGSRGKLEQMLNRQVKLFSSPYGEFDDRTASACKEAGYDRVFTNVPSLAFSKPREFVTGRVGASPSDWPVEFRLKMAGAYRWVPYAYALKRRIFSRSRDKNKQVSGRYEREKREESWNRGVSTR